MVNGARPETLVDAPRVGVEQFAIAAVRANSQKRLTHMPSSRSPHSGNNWRNRSRSRLFVARQTGPKGLVDDEMGRAAVPVEQYLHSADHQSN